MDEPTITIKEPSEAEECPSVRKTCQCKVCNTGFYRDQAPTVKIDDQEVVVCATYNKCPCDKYTVIAGVSGNMSTCESCRPGYYKVLIPTKSTATDEYILHSTYKP